MIEYDFFTDPETDKMYIKARTYRMEDGVKLKYGCKIEINKEDEKAFEAMLPYFKSLAGGLAKFGEGAPYPQIVVE